MRGKKSNKEFISNYIENCVENGIDSLDDIYMTVNNKIIIIDNKIKEVEQLKKQRTDLLDVKEFLRKTLNG